MQVTIIVHESDLAARTPDTGPVERALHRALLIRFPDVDFVHEGLTELGFVVGEDKYECRLKGQIKKQFDDINYGLATLPQKFQLHFEKLTD